MNYIIKTTPSISLKWISLVMIWHFSSKAVAYTMASAIGSKYLRLMSAAVRAILSVNGINLVLFIKDTASSAAPSVFSFFIFL